MGGVLGSPPVKPLLWGLLGLFVLGLLVAVGYQQRALRAAALRQDSLEVAADSSRRFWVGEVQVAARRAFQAEVQLTHALQQGRAAGAALVHARLEADSLRRISTGRTTEDTSRAVVVATGELVAESLGVTVTADVAIAPVRTLGPVVSTFQWDLVRHPVLLDVALVCLPGHRAEARISSPSAVPLTVIGATSRADVCYPPPRWSPFSLQPPSLPWLVGAFGLGLLVR